MDAPYRIVSEIFEGNAKHPIVTHIFRGSTPRQAQAFFNAHLKTDEFFRSCVRQRMFRKFTCREKHQMERYHPGLGWRIFE